MPRCHLRSLARHRLDFVPVAAASRRAPRPALAHAIGCNERLAFSDLHVIEVNGARADASAGVRSKRRRLRAFASCSVRAASLCEPLAKRRTCSVGSERNRRRVEPLPPDDFSRAPPDPPRRTCVRVSASATFSRALRAYSRRTDRDRRRRNRASSSSSLRATSRRASTMAARLATYTSAASSLQSKKRTGHRAVPNFAFHGDGRDPRRQKTCFEAFFSKNDWPVDSVGIALQRQRPAREVRQNVTVRSAR